MQFVKDLDILVFSKSLGLPFSVVLGHFTPDVTAVFVLKHLTLCMEKEGDENSGMVCRWKWRWKDLMISRGRDVAML